MSKVESYIAPQEITSSEIKILKAVLYFNIFNHPLSIQEIIRFSELSNTEINDLPALLQNLISRNFLFEINGYYLINNQPLFVQRRLEGQHLAKRYLTRAILVSRIISWFPFVRGVMISGSLSKDYMDAGSDIDYFIVTEKGRLWVCRSILALLRKVMIGPMRKYFCINYFVAIDALQIPDQNIFTATEIVTVYPTYGIDVYQLLQHSNQWTKQYLPNAEVRVVDINSKKYVLSLKSLFEWIFSGSLGERLDTYLFKLMLKRWKNRYNHFDESEFDVNMRTKKNIAKQHEKGHQFVILQKYKSQIDVFEQQHGIKLNG
ncbi:MAG: hypothetical protein MUC81_09905 [Bacteroidia bacterium]|nr:hypothetical protein [Bacteroidia bacterium]